MVIDSDYRGPVKVALHNDTNANQVVSPYERIAQLVVCPYTPITIELVHQLDETDRGEGGFGSSGKF